MDIKDHIEMSVAQRDADIILKLEALKDGFFQEAPSKAFARRKSNLEMYFTAKQAGISALEKAIGAILNEKPVIMKPKAFFAKQLEIYNLKPDGGSGYIEEVPDEVKEFIKSVLD